MIAFLLALGLAFLVAALIFRKRQPAAAGKSASTDNIQNAKLDKAPKDYQDSTQREKIQKNKFSCSACSITEHPNFFREVGGHRVDVIAVASSPDGTLLASLSRDGILKVQAVKDIGSSNQLFSAFATVPGDFVLDCNLCWTPNSKRIALNVGNKILFYRPDLFGQEKKIVLAKELATDFNLTYNVQIIDVEKWMLVAVAGTVDDCHVVQLYNHSGGVVDRLTLIGYKKKMAKSEHIRSKQNIAVVSGLPILLSVSSDNRYVAISGHVGSTESEFEYVDECFDVKIYEVKRCKAGEAIGLSLRFILSGHSGPVAAFAWDSVGRRLVTSSRSAVGGTPEMSPLWSWRVWDLPATQYAEVKSLVSESISHPVDSKCEITFVGDIVYFCNKRDIYVCNALTGSVISSIQDAHGGNVTKCRLVTFSVGKDEGLSMSHVVPGQYLATLVSGAKKIALWKF
jgi:WD40 repeat protein